MGIKGKGRKQPVQAMSIASTGLIKINVFWFFLYFYYNLIIFFYKKRKIKKGQEKLLRTAIVIPATVICLRKN